MAEGPGEEEIEVTGSERVLAALLAIFIAVGAIWAYFEIDDRSGDPGLWGGHRVVHGPAWNQAVSSLDRSERQAIEDFEAAQQAVGQAERKAGELRRRMIVAREAYRTELDAGRPATAAEANYRDADADYEAAMANRAAAASAVAALSGEAERARSLAEAELRSRREAAEAEQASHDLRVFLLRLVMLILLLGAGLWLIGRGRSRLGRWYLIPIAILAATAALAVTMAVDYGNDLFDYRDLGPGLISLLGVLLTLVTMVLVQRNLARRLPYRRVRRGLCPFCGFPAGKGDHCEGCGRIRVGACSTCGESRRVGTRHCTTCGAR